MLINNLCYRKFDKERILVNFKIRKANIEFKVMFKKEWNYSFCFATYIKHHSKLCIGYNMNKYSVAKNFKTPIQWNGNNCFRNKCLFGIE